jgi:NAD(P)-dependent dehydrogenase (short-subunit alcohol dehydrogenase family)
MDDSPKKPYFKLEKRKTTMTGTLLISGANGHLGRAVCARLLQAGYVLEAALGPGDPLPIDHERLRQERVDLLDESRAAAYVRALVERCGAVDGAVLLAGGFAPGKLRETDRKSLDKMIDLNFRTAFHLVRPLMEHFEAEGGGRFVFISAKPALRPAAAQGAFAYALSKAMLVNMANIINADTKNKPISAAVIAPSTLDTPPNREAMPDADFSSWIPPSLIAETVAFFFSEAGLRLKNPLFEI